jgi:hypothetical protein
MVYNNFLPDTQRTQFVFMTKTSILIPLVEIFAISIIYT